MKRRQFLKQSAFAAAILPVPLQPLTFNQKKRQAKDATTGTLGQLRALDIQKRTVGGIEVFFTPGYEDRAVRLAEYVSEATAFFAESLRVKVEFHLAVLADTHWSKVRSLATPRSRISKTNISPVWSTAHKPGPITVGTRCSSPPWQSTSRPSTVWRF